MMVPLASPKPMRVKPALSAHARSTTVSPSSRKVRCSPLLSASTPTETARCADIVLAVGELAKRGVVFASLPHLIARMEDHDLWMAFFTDPDGHTLALMQEAPKGYVPGVTAAP